MPPYSPSSRTPAHKDLTPLFRDLASSSSSSSAPSPRRSNPHSVPPPSLKQAQLNAWKVRRQAEKAWDAEASKLRRNIDELEHFLRQVRKAYLHSGPVFPIREIEGEGADEQEQTALQGGARGLERYGKLRSLSEEEKDEVDLHLKLVLEKGVTRVKELIKAEEVRQTAQPTPESSTLSSSSLLTRLLSRPLPITSLDSIEYSSQLALHREAITASLGVSLKRVAEKVGQMQEARVRAREAREGKRVQLPSRSRGEGHGGRTRREAEISQKPILGSTSSFRALASTSSLSTSSSQDARREEEEEEELTQAQMHLFQSESSSLTKSLQADLTALQSVTSTLTTISSLQTTLIQHLSTQNETIASLGNQAGEQRVEVQRGNEQLKKAKERNRSANRMLGALLVGSGLGLLFLHVMD